MTQRVFSAGFVWRVIRAKWDGFEEAFDHFDPATVAAYDAEDIARLSQDERIVRNNQKIQATVKNARFVQANRPGARELRPVRRRLAEQ